MWVDICNPPPQDAATSARLDVEDRLLLEPSVPWITCPPALMVHSAGRSFDVRMWEGRG